MTPEEFKNRKAQIISEGNDPHGIIWGQAKLSEPGEPVIWGQAKFAVPKDGVIWGQAKLNEPQDPGIIWGQAKLAGHGRTRGSGPSAPSGPTLGRGRE